MAIALSSFPQSEVVLQIGIRFGNFDHLLKGQRMKGRSSQVGVDHDSGRIDHPAQPRPGLKMDLLLEEGIEVLEREEGFIKLRDFFFTEEFFPKAPQALSNGIDHYSSGMDFQEIDDLRP